MNEHCIYIFDYGQNASKLRMECCYPVRKNGSGQIAPCSKSAKLSNKVLCDVHTKIYEDVQRTWMNRVFTDGQDPIAVFGDKNIMRMDQLEYLVKKKIELFRFSLLSPYEVETKYQSWRWGVMKVLDEMNGASDVNVVIGYQTSPTPQRNVVNITQDDSFDCMTKRHPTVAHLQLSAPDQDLLSL